VSDFQIEERKRVLARIAHHVHEARCHLARVRRECLAFGVDLALPDDKILSAAAERCAEIFKQPPETPA
jgi:hypothetical protein